MKKLLFTVSLATACAIFMHCAGAASAGIAAPAEAISTANALLDYLLKDKNDICNDRPRQEQWLTVALREALVKKQQICAQELKKRPDENIESPSNTDFLLAWETPSAFTIVGSRQYNTTAFVDVEFSWGKGKNYEGNKRIQSYIFILENGSWKLDDVYNAREKFAEPGTLVQSLRDAP